MANDYSVEFNDSVLDLEGWKNPRFEGSKLIGNSINTFTQGDVTYGKNPVLENKTTALYIGNTLIGGENENEQYAFIKGHSYININKILIINPESNEITIIDSKAEDFTPFQQFVTNDLPTGASFSFRLLDTAIQNSLDEIYFVKFNKGWLLKAFTFENPVFGSVQGTYGDTDESGTVITTITNNKQTNRPSMIISDNLSDAGGQFGSGFSDAVEDKFVFVYASPYFDSGSVGDSSDGFLRLFGPSYHDSEATIHENKFTLQYYGDTSPAQGTGSFGRITGSNYGFEPVKAGVSNFSSFNGGTNDSNPIGDNALVKAADFISNKTLNFLSTHNAKDISVREKTELHITFFKGQELIGANTEGVQDERSISTFEIDKLNAQPNLQASIDPCNVGISVPIITMKGKGNDTRFKYNNFATSASSTLTVQYATRLAENTYTSNLNFINRINSRDAVVSTSPISLGEFNYSGLFEYEISFLDKAPTIIANIDKEVQLYDGVGERGFVLIPNQLNQKIKDNLEYYLEKAGLIDKTTRNISPKRGR